jgi:hypothetical protein
LHAEAPFRELVAEAKASEAQYRLWYHYVMRPKCIHHCGQMLPWVLEHLTFRSENCVQPVIEALAVIKQYLGTKYHHFPAEVPSGGVVQPTWRDTVMEAHKDGTVRVNRRYDELCVLQQLGRALKCKETLAISKGCVKVFQRSQGSCQHLRIWENTEGRVKRMQSSHRNYLAETNLERNQRQSMEEFEVTTIIRYEGEVMVEGCSAKTGGVLAEPKRTELVCSVRPPEHVTQSRTPPGHGGRGGGSDIHVMVARCRSPQQVVVADAPRAGRAMSGERCGAGPCRAHQA